MTLGDKKKTSGGGFHLLAIFYPIPKRTGATNEVKPTFV
jgi:hypothetical protein